MHGEEEHDHDGAEKQSAEGHWKPSEQARLLIERTRRTWLPVAVRVTKPVVAGRGVAGAGLNMQTTRTYEDIVEHLIDGDLTSRR